jgi:hypothetical protein
VQAQLLSTQALRALGIAVVTYYRIAVSFNEILDSSSLDALTSLLRLGYADNDPVMHYGAANSGQPDLQ